MKAKLRLKLPPAVVFLMFAGAMYLLAQFLPVGYFDFFGRLLLCRFLIVLAIAIACIAIGQFLRARTTIDPMKPERAVKLITGGIYKFSRNPMYLALLILLLAWGLWLTNAFNTLLAAGFVYYMNAFQIEAEEEALFQEFGREYEHYCVRVRRWF